MMNNVEMHSIFQVFKNFQKILSETKNEFSHITLQTKIVIESREYCIKMKIL